MKLLSELRKELTDIVEGDSSLNDTQKIEMGAIITHFLQNHKGKIPLLSKEVRLKWLLHINQKINDDYDLLLGEDTDQGKRIGRSVIQKIRH